MNIKIGEINIICTDIVRSLRFYRDVLGFTLIETEGIAHHLRCGSVQFLLLPVAERQNEFTPYCTVPAFSIDLLVDDIETTVHHLQAHGVTFENDWKRGDDHVFVRDPDGLVLEVIQRKAT